MLIVENGHLQVKGPLAGPFAKTEELAAAACEIMTRQPGASSGAYGVEYCALHYYSDTAKAFFLSYLSDVGGDGAGGRKFSNADMSEDRHWQPTRFVDGTTGRIWDRSLLLLFREKTGACRAYLYDNTSRAVLALREGSWVKIGRAKGFHGEFELLDGQDWVF